MWVFILVLFDKQGGTFTTDKKRQMVDQGHTLQLEATRNQIAVFSAGFATVLDECLYKRGTVGAMVYWLYSVLTT